MAYTKPVFGTLSQDSENCGCCFFVTDSGQGVYVYTEGIGIGKGAAVGKPNLDAVGSQGIASVGSNGASVTPLCGTGLPATQPITFGVPIGAVSRLVATDGLPLSIGHIG